MKDFSFYEQCGILIPGSLFLFGLLLLEPTLKTFFTDADGISVGGLGLFVLVAYAAGHGVAAVGNLLEKVLWWFWSGMPSNWVTHTPPKILNTEQIKNLQVRIKERLHLDLPHIQGITQKEWAVIFGQIQRDTLVSSPGRIETFNGNYGLNRGLAAALVALLPILLYVRPTHWKEIAALVLLLALIYTYRAYRFRIHFAREVLYNFLNLPNKKEPSKGNSS